MIEYSTETAAQRIMELQRLLKLNTRSWELRKPSDESSAYLNRRPCSYVCLPLLYHPQDFQDDLLAQQIPLWIQFDFVSSSQRRIHMARAPVAWRKAFTVAWQHLSGNSLTRISNSTAAPMKSGQQATNEYIGFKHSCYEFSPFYTTTLIWCMLGLSSLCVLSISASTCCI